MKTREIGRSLSNVAPNAKRRGFSRRSVLTFAGTLGAAAPFGIFGAARALTASGVGSLPYIPGESLFAAPRRTAKSCRARRASSNSPGMRTRPARSRRLSQRSAASSPSTTSMSNSSISAERPTSC